MAAIKRRDGTMVRLLTSVVIVLVISHTPRTFINLYESYNIVMFGKLHEQPIWAGVVIKTSHLLLTFSSAVNILIYYFKDFKFRAILRSFFSLDILYKSRHGGQGREELKLTLAENEK